MPSASQKLGSKPAPFPDLSPPGSPQTGSKRKFKAEDDEDAPAVKRSTRTFKAYAEHHKHEKHYYPDGNILLQVGKTRFKIHRSRLASESTWFQGLIDHYEGTTPEGQKVDKDVEDVVDKADEVGDDPLFFLEAAEGEEVPSAEEFAALLTAIYDGINYVFNPPTIDEICSMYGPAWYYSFQKYYDFAEKSLLAFFPDFEQVTKEPSLHSAVEAICLHDRYDLETTFPRVLHDVARASRAMLEECLQPPAEEQENAAPPPVAPPANQAPAPVGKPQEPAAANANAEDDDAEDDEGGSDEDEEDEDEEDANIITKIKATHFTRILILQRHLSTAWEPIVMELVVIVCPKACGVGAKPITLIEAISAIRLKYPCDPLLGIQELLKSPVIAKCFCKHMQATFVTKMGARKAHICKQLRETWTK